MKKIIKKITLIILLATMFLAVADCSISSKFYHDKYNPCLEGQYRNAEECDYWKSHYPKEYQRFLNRIELDSIK